MAGGEHPHIEHRLRGGLFDVGTGLVEFLDGGRGDRDEGGMPELGMASGEFLLAGLDIVLATAFPGSEPEPVVFLLAAVGFECSEFPVRRSCCFPQR